MSIELSPTDVRMDERIIFGHAPDRPDSLDRSIGSGARSNRGTDLYGGSPIGLSTGHNVIVGKDDTSTRRTAIVDCGMVTGERVRIYHNCYIPGRTGIEADAGVALSNGFFPRYAGSAAAKQEPPICARFTIRVTRRPFRP